MSELRKVVDIEGKKGEEKAGEEKVGQGRTYLSSEFQTGQ